MVLCVPLTQNAQAIIAINIYGEYPATVQNDPRQLHLLPVSALAQKSQGQIVLKELSVVQAIAFLEHLQIPAHHLVHVVFKRVKLLPQLALV